MTGIERLRVLCRNVMNEPSYARHISHYYLDSIASQIERETLQKPRFEDGEPVRCGDMAMFGNKPREVVEYEVNDCGVAILHTYGDCWSLLPGQRLKRPEPPDTWERIEADVDSGKGYAGMDAAEVAADVLRRCKAVAGVE